jgi:hypothetical protein
MRDKPHYLQLSVLKEAERRSAYEREPGTSTTSNAGSNETSRQSDPCWQAVFRTRRVPPLSPSNRTELESTTHLESLILQHLLDRNLLLGRVRPIRLLLAQHLCRENDTKTSVSNDFAVCVGDGSFVACLSVGCGDGDDAGGVIVGCEGGRASVWVRPFS